MIADDGSDKASAAKGLGWLGAGLAIAVICALGIAPLVRMIPWSWERKLADYTAAASPENICSGSPEADRLLKQLTKRLYPLDPEDAAIPIHIHVMDTSIINAYAGLGGKIMLNKGLLMAAQSPEEVAGVLAHEIEHVRRRHILQAALTHLFATGAWQMVSAGGASTGAEWTHIFLDMSFSRGQEAEADEGGLQRLQKAHISNQGFKEFFERMGEEESAPAFLSDHPSSRDRYRRVSEFSNKDVLPIMAHAQWLVLQSYCE